MILTVTANAAIDKRYVAKNAELGKVNRISSCEMSAGGKGLNVARNVKLYGKDVMATGFIGGHAGEFIREEVKKSGIKESFVSVPGESRSCINLFDEETKVQTEYLEPGITLSKESIDKFLIHFKELLKQVTIVTISGSLPKGCDSSLYISLVKECKNASIPVILDASGKLLTDCLSVHPTLIKPNQDELSAIFNRELNSTEEVIKAAKELLLQGPEYVIVSLGKKGSVCVSKEGCYQAIVPEIDAVNTVGCGDSMIAGMAIGMSENRSIADSLKLASAISAANAMNIKTGYFEKADMDAIYPQVKINQL